MSKRKPRLMEMILALNESDMGMKKIGASPAAPPSPMDAHQKQMEVENMINSISKYGEYGSALKRATTMQEVGTQLAQIAELAEQAVMQEADDSYDQHTLKRNMQEIKKYAGAFAKLAQEADMINQRMTAYYDDMGRILERYFELPDAMDNAGGQELPSGRTPTDVPPAGGDSAVTDTAASASASDDDIKLDEEALEGTLELTPDRPVKEKPSPNGSEFDHFEEDSAPAGHAKTTPGRGETGHNLDQLTLKAIVLVHNRLKKENPDAARRFKQLPPQKMAQVVWRLVK